MDTIFTRRTDRNATTVCTETEQILTHADDPDMSVQTYLIKNINSDKMRGSDLYKTRSEGFYCKCMRLSSVTDEEEETACMLV